MARRLDVTVYICAYKFNATENNAWSTDLEKNLEFNNLGCLVWLAFSFGILRNRFQRARAMIAAPLILGGDLKISDQNNWGGPEQKIKYGGELNLREDLKF